jgi:release factor glutamine methyltransferase
MRTVVFPGVLRPPSDAWLLIDVMRERSLARDATVLDLFTGSGVLAVAAALEGATAVTAVDIARRAVLNARLNAKLNRVGVRVLRGDLFAPLDGEWFDLILANPPYLPSEDEGLPTAGPARAWEGGVDGRLLVDRLCREAPRHLAEGGCVLIVHSSLCGEVATLESLAAAGLRGETLARQRGALGPIAASRAELLEWRGLLAPGEREEEMLVIGATPTDA